MKINFVSAKRNESTVKLFASWLQAQGHDVESAERRSDSQDWPHALVILVDSEDRGPAKGGKIEDWSPVSLVVSVLKNERTLTSATRIFELNSVRDWESFLLWLREIDCSDAQISKPLESRKHHTLQAEAG